MFLGVFLLAAVDVALLNNHFLTPPIISSPPFFCLRFGFRSELQLSLLVQKDRVRREEAEESKGRPFAPTRSGINLRHFPPTAPPPRCLNNRPRSLSLCRRIFRFCSQPTRQLQFWLVWRRTWLFAPPMKET